MSGGPNELLADLPVEDVEEELQRQYNLIEKIKSWFDVDDDALAVLIAQNLRIHGTQQAILAALRGQPIELPETGEPPNFEQLADEIAQAVREVDITVDFDTEEGNITVNVDEVISPDEVGDAVADAVGAELEDIEIDVSIDSTELEVDTLTEEELRTAFIDGARQVSEGRLIAFPNDGYTFSLPAGAGAGNRHEIDLADGSITINGVGSRNLEGSLQQFDAEVARSAQVWFDDEVVLRTFDELDNLTGVWEADRFFSTIRDADIERVEIDAVRPVDMQAQFSTAPDPPAISAPVSGHTKRFGYLITNADTLQTIPFVGPNAEDFGENTLRAAAENFGVADLGGQGIDTHHWIVQNNSTNDAEVQARVYDFDFPAADDATTQKAADEDIHGSVDPANSNVITVQAEDFAFLESSITGGFFRLLAQCAVANDTVELFVQYLGTTPGRR